MILRPDYPARHPPAPDGIDRHAMQLEFGCSRQVHLPALAPRWNRLNCPGIGSIGAAAGVAISGIKPLRMKRISEKSYTTRSVYVSSFVSRSAVAIVSCAYLGCETPKPASRGTQVSLRFGCISRDPASRDAAEAFKALGV